MAVVSFARQFYWINEIKNYAYLIANGAGEVPDEKPIVVSDLSMFSQFGFPSGGQPEGAPVVVVNSYQ